MQDMLVGGCEVQGCGGDRSNQVLRPCMQRKDDDTPGRHALCQPVSLRDSCSQ